MTHTVSVIGLGYVGLPLALLMSHKGIQVRGVDIDEKKLEAIRSKKIVIEDSFVRTIFQNTTLPVSNKLESSDVYIICVPTPVDERNFPDIRPLKGAIDLVCSVLQNGQLVVVESTVYPGMCQEELQPLLDRAGKRYLLAHCPERINPGDAYWNVTNIPRVVGGIDAESTSRAATLYRKTIDASVMELSSIRNAEATKILENIFRDVNTALVNEMAQSFYRMNIDIKEVIGAAATKPFSFMPHYPGVGVGGHCIAVDPYYMIEKGKAAGFDHELLRIARKINTNMPIYTVYLLQNTFNSLGLALKGRKIGVYGLAYKPNVRDTRESPSFEVIHRLRDLKEADVAVYDPYIPERSTVSGLPELLSHSEALVVCTAHKEITLLDYELLRNKGIRVIVDGRNCLDKDKIEALGIIYRGIGRG